MKRPVKYRKKPVVIEAMQHLDGDRNGDEILEWIGEHGGDARIYNTSPDLYIFTLEGEMRADVGDYIIKGVKGEFYPCKPDIFEATHEFVEFGQ